MALARVKSWSSGEVLTASDLNAEFNSILNNARDLVSPLTASLDMNGFEFVLDGDGDTSLTVDTDDRLDLRIGGVDLFVWDGTTASSVNGITFTSAATGSGATIGSTGSDTNIPITLKGKGTGRVILGQATSTDLQLAADQPIADSSGNEYIKFTKTASAVNEVTVTNAATDTNPSIAATGGDTDIDLLLEGKGAGGVIAALNANVGLVGGYLDWSVASSVLTVAVKTWAGLDPSATDPVYIYFRSATAGTGSVTRRKLTSATSVAINDTASLGTTSSVAFRIWAVAFDDAGTVRLGVINCLSTTSIYPLAGWGIASSTQEGDGADSALVFYTDGAAVSSKSFATLGFASWESGLGTAGTWSAAPTRAQLFGPGVPLPGHVIQVVRTDTSAHATGTTQIPADDTIPQNTEGNEFMTRAITPTSTANLLAVDMLANLSSTNSSGGTTTEVITAALFQDTTADALKAVMTATFTVDLVALPISYRALASTTSETTFKVRAGVASAETVGFNGSPSSRTLGGVMNSYMQVQEIMA